MSAKEKANELIEKFRPHTQYLFEAIDCAIICAEELVKLSYDSRSSFKEHEFLTLVVAELEKMKDEEVEI